MTGCSNPPSPGVDYEKGDIGSGYWIGKQILDQIIINEGILNIDKELEQLFKIVKKQFGINNLSSLVDAISNEEDSIYNISSLTKLSEAVVRRGLRTFFLLPTHGAV